METTPLRKNLKYLKNYAKSIKTGEKKMKKEKKNYK
jgi:hypothetical protein